jgi:hypothetical protein
MCKEEKKLLKSTAALRATIDNRMQGMERVLNRIKNQINKL